MTDTLLNKYKTIGQSDASERQEREEFLPDCFQDNNDVLDILRDLKRSGFLLGRAGTGKTALLQQLLKTLKSEEKAEELTVRNYATYFITNLNIPQFLESSEINVTGVLQELWGHVFALEVLKLYFGPDRLDRRVSLFDRLLSRKKRAYFVALDYVQTWEDRFWIDYQEEQRRRTKTKGRKLGTQAGAGPSKNIPAQGSFSFESQQGESTETTEHPFLTPSIDETLLRKLNKIFYIINQILDKDKQYFIVVDGLHTGWVEDEKTRYHLIKALIEAVKRFNQEVHRAKIIVALRPSLLARMREMPSPPDLDSGACVEIAWKCASLHQLLDTRIKKKYNGYTSKELLPSTKADEEPIKYLLDHTLLCPRDAIRFFNMCIIKADGKDKIEPRDLGAAEEDYSMERRESLIREWSECYPNLDFLFKLLEGKHASFDLDKIDNDKLKSFCEDVLWLRPHLKEGEDLRQIVAFEEGKIRFSDFRAFIVSVLYRVGAIGVKRVDSTEVQWSYDNGPKEISHAQISNDTIINVHEMLWKNLKISPVETPSTVP